VRAQDVRDVGARLHIIGEAAAGRFYDGTLMQGQAVRIFTGAPVPKGADTVVIQEDTSLIEPTIVEIRNQVKIHANIRPLGGDFHANTLLLASSSLLTPAALSLCAAAGHGQVDVIVKPRVALVSTGDELVEAGCVPKEGQIVASNFHGLAEIVRLHGGEVLNLGIVPDKAQAIEQAIEAACAQQADILLTSGGVSVGAYDLVQEVLCAAGMQLDFWKIAMRPGKPLMFGRLPISQTVPERDILVLGLPGNPVSAMVSAHLFLVPMLEKMAGLPQSFALYEAILTTPLPANGPRRHYIRAHMTKSNSGEILVAADSSFDSSLLSVLARANCLIVVPENSPERKKGDLCQIFIPKTGL